MLDLAYIFDPEQQVLFTSRAASPTAVPAASVLGVEDLPGDWRVEWEERAAVLEYDGKIPRERAEAQALTEILGKMLRTNGFPRA
jgi:hypothetical protein